MLIGDLGVSLIQQIIIWFHLVQHVFQDVHYAQYMLIVYWPQDFHLPSQLGFLGISRLILQMALPMAGHSHIGFMESHIFIFSFDINNILLND